MSAGLRAAALLAAALAAGCGSSVLPATEAPRSGTAQWVGAWGTAGHQTLRVSDQTLRMIVRPTLAGERVRVRLSNAYGDVPAHYTRLMLALRTQGPAIDAATQTPVTFDGQPSVTVGPGEERISDPIPFAYALGDDLALSFHVPADTPLDQHGNAVAISYTAAGDQVEDSQGSAFDNAVLWWAGFIGLDVESAEAAGTFVAIGDSITDGGNPPERNNRWPDYFAQRLQAAGIVRGVLNAGIGANQVTRDTNFLGTSEAAVKRFERDVLQRPAVDTVLIFEGTNDLSGGVPASEIFAGLADMAARARSRGLHVLMATVTPRGRDPLWSSNPALEAQRLELNALIRAAEGSSYDTLVDFDAVLAMPGMPAWMAPQYDSGDGLHPSPLGLQALADAVPLTLR